MQHPTAGPPFRHPAGEQPEDAALADFPLEERILVVLAQQPWASAADIAKRLGLWDSDVSKSGIHWRRTN